MGKAAYPRGKERGIERCAAEQEVVWESGVIACGVCSGALGYSSACSCVLEGDSPPRSASIHVILSGAHGHGMSSSVSGSGDSKHQSTFGQYRAPSVGG